MAHVPVVSPHPHSNNTNVNTQALNIFSASAFAAVSLILQFSLASLLFGVLTVLAASSVFLLLRRRALTNASLRTPLLTTIILYTSTSLYMAALIWDGISLARIMREANKGLLSETYDGNANLLSLEKTGFKEYSMATAGLIANVVVGDAVVWWRACVIWQHKAIYYAGPIALLLTLVFGIVGGLRQLPVLVGNAFVDAAFVLSLATNFTATVLISIKAFFHYRFLKKYLSSSGGMRPVLKVFALLVESGSLYCVILLFVLLYMATDATGPLANVGYFLSECIVPLVAIYPTSIVFLTALNWSPLDWGLSDPIQAPVSPSHPMRRQSSDVHSQETV